MGTFTELRAIQRIAGAAFRFCLVVVVVAATSLVYYTIVAP